LKNYIVGYGSLFNTKSLQRTLPSVSYIEPMYLNNYLRSWNAIENKTVTLSTTYLGIQKSKGSRLNAILFEIDESLLDNLDKREFLYTREEVNLEDVELISSKFSISSDDKIWIYITNTPEKPSKQYPIIQSYVDTCISGCLELEEKFNIENFANDFINTTINWSKSWVNDRIFPRAPHVHQAYAYKIDELLNNNIEEFFSKITIE